MTRAPSFALVALALVVACEHHEEQPVRVPPPAVPIAAPDSECPPISLDEPSPPATVAAPPAPRPDGSVDLAVLRPDARRGAPPRAPRKWIDLGRTPRKVRPPHPRAEVDLATLSLPSAVPRPDLRPDLQRLWDRDDATLHELRLAQIQYARADRKLRECDEKRCPELACIDKRKRELDGQVHAVRDRRAGERRELTARLRQHAEGLGDKTPAGVLLALAGTLDGVARGETESSADLALLMKEPVALYERAAVLAAPASDIGWFARYLLGVLLDDAGASGKAMEVWSALAQASPPGLYAAEASYRAASLERDPGRAALAYRRAVDAASKGTPQRTAALLRWARAAFAAERPADGLTAGALLCEETAAMPPDEGGDFMVEGADVVAEALGRVLAAGGVTPALPKVPAVAFAPIAARVAADALHRFDVALAVHAWKALVAHASGSAEAPAALAGLAAAHERALWPVPVTEAARRSEMEARLRELVRSCGNTHHIGEAAFELTVTVDAGVRPAKVTVRPAPDGLPRCLEARGAAYFVDAPANLRATLVLTSGL